jgi:hypothetical protein
MDSPETKIAVLGTRVDELAKDQSEIWRHINKMPEVIDSKVKDASEATQKTTGLMITNATNGMVVKISLAIGAFIGLIEGVKAVFL